MANTNNESILNFGRFELRQVKNAYNSNRANYKKREKLYEKVRALGAEIDTINQMIESWEAPIKHLSMNKLGVELTSDVILLSYDDPAKFLEMYPQFGATETAEAQEESTEEQAEEAPVEEASNFPF